MPLSLPPPPCQNAIVRANPSQKNWETHPSRAPRGRRWCATDRAREQRCGGFQELLLGSTSHAVLHVASCPAMIVHSEVGRRTMLSRRS
ncbi:universal stress protein [Gordonia oryzae]|uniref:universal stress protein n=1 Tax=Gordonia oryzae TaxID=2487349 RepID=UPI003CCC8A87